MHMTADRLILSVQVPRKIFRNMRSDDNNTYTKTSGGNITFQFYNTKDKIFSNKKIREAFTLAVDHDDMNDMGFSEMTHSLTDGSLRHLQLVRRAFVKKLEIR